MRQLSKTLIMVAVLLLVLMSSFSFAGEVDYPRVFLMQNSEEVHTMTTAE